MIPKIIHYCWFGGKPKPPSILKCMQSWQEIMPDYKITQWDESNFDIDLYQFTKNAYQQRKWAFVSDVARAHALHSEGGIYLDTDVEIRRPLDKFLIHGAFSGFERIGLPFTAVWGAAKSHHWPQKVLDYYRNADFSLEPNTAIISELLRTQYGIDPNRDTLQRFQDDIYIYPSNFFCVDIINYAVHHFEGSWMDNKQSFHWKDHVRESYIRDRFFNQRASFFDTLDEIQSNYHVKSAAIIRHLIMHKIRSLLKPRRSKPPTAL